MKQAILFDLSFRPSKPERSVTGKKYRAAQSRNPVTTSQMITMNK
jgi:hypothetical protein